MSGGGLALLIAAIMLVIFVFVKIGEALGQIAYEIGTEQLFLVISSTAAFIAVCVIGYRYYTRKEALRESEDTTPPESAPQENVTKYYGEQKPVFTGAAVMPEDRGRLALERLRGSPLSPTDKSCEQTAETHDDPRTQRARRVVKLTDNTLMLKAARKRQQELLKEVKRLQIQIKIEEKRAQPEPPAVKQYDSIDAAIQDTLREALKNLNNDRLLERALKRRDEKRAEVEPPAPAAEDTASDAVIHPDNLEEQRDKSNQPQSADKGETADDQPPWRQPPLARPAPAATKPRYPKTEPLSPADTFFKHLSIAGAQFFPAEDVQSVQSGAKITFQPEPSNEHDPNAILILNERDKPIGYIRRSDNELPCALMNKGVEFYGIVTTANIEANYISYDMWVRG